MKTKMYKDGITVDVVFAADIQRYISAGYTRVIEQPVERQAVEQVAPQTSTVEPAEVQEMEVKAEQTAEKEKPKERKKNGKS